MIWSAIPFTLDPDLVQNKTPGKTHWPFDLFVNKAESLILLGLWKQGTRKGKEKSQKHRSQTLPRSQKILIVPLVFCVCGLGPH